jgi:membrane fusion protein, multidrug efflux system
MVKRVVLFLSVATSIAVGAYLITFGWPGQRSPEQAPAAAALPPAEVGVMVVQTAEVPFPIEYAGRVAGFRDVEIRPLVSGLLKREYEEGPASRPSTLPWKPRGSASGPSS